MFQFHAIRLPTFALEVSVNTICLVSHNGEEKLKPASGNGFTTVALVMVSLEQPLSVNTNSFTESVPADKYKCRGFCTESIPPSPKFHFHLTIVFPLPSLPSENTVVSR